MTYSDYSITLEEYIEFTKTGILTGKLLKIWEDLLSRLEESGELDVKKEAEKSKITLVSNPDIEDDVIAEYKVIKVINASPKLEKVFFEKLYPYVVCLKV